MIKKIALSLFVIFAVLFAYANFRHQNPSTALEPIDVRTLEYQKRTEVPLTDYVAWVKKSPYVHGCSLDEAGQTIGVTYEFQNMTEAQLMDRLSFNGSLEITQKEFAQNKPGCPVHGVLASWEKFLHAIRIVE